MSTSRVVYSTSGLTVAGAPLTLTLTLDAAQTSTAIEIQRLELRPHKELLTTVLSVTALTDEVAPLAKDMTTIAHELERLHHQGYWLRERSVGLRGVWHNDLCHPAGRLVQSWPTTPKRAEKTVAQLAAALAETDVPVAQDRPPDRGEVIETIMRERSMEVMREHEINSYLAEHPLSSSADLLDDLDRKDLLGPGHDQ